jgi:hypothetical protein
MRAKASVVLIVAIIFPVISVVSLALRVPLARAVSLTLGADGAELAMDHVTVLYVSRPGGETTPILRVGDSVPGGTISEFGVPYQLIGGRVLFGADIIDAGQHESWDIFIASPGTHGGTQITRELEHTAVSPGCAPRFIEDPSPVASADGAIAFVAPVQSGGDAVFVSREGELRCAARTGDKTDGGHRIARFAFGSMQLGADGTTIVANAFVRGGRVSHAALWWHDDPLAIVEITPTRGISEIAVEGETAPGGNRYAVLGLPALATTRGEVVFADDGPGENSVYVSEHGRTRLVLERGAASPGGTIIYIGQGRPGIASDGTIALRGASRSREMILRLNQRGRIRVVATARETASAPGELASFGDPVAPIGAATIFPAMDSAGAEGIFFVDPHGAIHEVDSAPVHNAAFEIDAPARHFVASPTLSVAPDGSFCYLGGR